MANPGSPGKWPLKRRVCGIKENNTKNVLASIVKKWFRLTYIANNTSVPALLKKRVVFMPLPLWQGALSDDVRLHV